MLTALLLSLSFLLAAGCLMDDPVKVKQPGPVEWPDMTDRDDVIATILLCYGNPENKEAMPRYERLLHSQYFFAFDAEDVLPPGESPILTRAQDIVSTQWLFENNVELRLSIDPAEGGTWSQIDELDGVPCANCWEGRREYQIRYQKTNDDHVLQSNPGAAAVTIIVAPDESDPGRWVLRALFDEYEY
jgi:hypothetical protein